MKKEWITSGSTLLGIELGSTRIKAILTAPDGTPLASGSYTWENRLENGVWTYALEDVWRASGMLCGPEGRCVLSIRCQTAPIRSNLRFRNDARVFGI